METCDFSSLPEDMLIEILSWLPVKSLLRFGCICKSWYVLVKNPNFISKQLNNGHRRILVCCRANDNPLKLLSYETLDVVCDDIGHRYGFGYGVDMPLLGLYNGIVCLYDLSLYRILFVNPARGELKIADGYQHIGGAEEYFGFGYDFKTNDYKVTGITFFSSRYLTNYRVQVYSLNHDSWRDSDAVIPLGICFNCHYQNSMTCVKGIYSRVVYRYNKKMNVCDYLLLTFDMSNEVFIVTPMPETVDLGKRLTYFGELNNLVALIHQFQLSLSMSCYEIWVLDDYGSNGAWRKLYRIAPLSDIYCPLVFWKNEELIFGNCHGELLTYNLKTRDAKKIEIGYQPLRLLEYKESLISLTKRVCSCSEPEPTHVNGGVLSGCLSAALKLLHIVHKFCCRLSSLLKA